MKFSIKDFFSKCDQIRRKLRIWSHLLMKSLMENFIFCPVKSGSDSKQITDFTIQGDMGISNKQRDHDYCQIFPRVRKQGSGFSVKISQGFSWVEVESRGLSDDIQTMGNTKFRSICTQVSHQVSVYVNWKLDSICKGRNAFQSSWTGMRRYAFPLCSLVDLVLSKVERQ